LVLNLKRLSRCFRQRGHIVRQPPQLSDQNLARAEAINTPDKQMVISQCAVPPAATPQFTPRNIALPVPSGYDDISETFNFA